MGDPNGAVGARLQIVPTLLVEPNTLLREGLKRILSETPYSPVASAASLDEVRGTWAAGADPFLLIMDAANDHDSKCNQVSQLKADLPTARVVMLVDYYDLKRVLAAFQAGADGYLVKSVSCEVLVKSLDLVMLGEAVFPSAILNLLREHSAVEDESSAEQQDDDQESPPRGLSVRETVILRCLMEGDSNKLIARKFDITEATVKVHVKAILRKIRAKNRTQAAIWAASHLPSNGRGAARS
ncbi:MULTISPECIES: LuxR C-terminal-related transcriptional regulator [Microvirga]|uniref:LuxR C-terminal-related transcriptional regulator n=1 Tax=Microvirga TaxID=186650 RepID=UPI001CFCBFEF|nr:response regulator transcription factor [Microvirga lenta]MCB5173879.1 response regulator transcription factor [Microvirga lenta]